MFNLLLTCGVIGLILVLFRYQQIPYFGNRLMYLLLFIVFIIWGGWILFYKMVVMPKEINKEKEKENFQKYLPRQKAGMSKKAIKNKI